MLVFEMVKKNVSSVTSCLIFIQFTAKDVHPKNQIQVIFTEILKCMLNFTADDVHVDLVLDVLYWQHSE